MNNSITTETEVTITVTCRVKVFTTPPPPGKNEKYFEGAIIEGINSKDFVWSIVQSACTGTDVCFDGREKRRSYLWFRNEEELLEVMCPAKPCP